MSPVASHPAHSVKVKPDVFGHHRTVKGYARNGAKTFVVPRRCLHKPCGIFVWRYQNVARTRFALEPNVLVVSPGVHRQHGFAQLKLALQIHLNVQVVEFGHGVVDCAVPVAVVWVVIVRQTGRRLAGSKEHAVRVADGEIAVNKRIVVPRVNDLLAKRRRRWRRRMRRRRRRRRRR